MTLDPTDLLAALTELTDDERTALEARVISVSCTFAATGAPRPASLFHALGVLVAEEGDRRVALAEHARVELDGDDTGGLVTDLGAMLDAARAELLDAARDEATDDAA